MKMESFFEKFDRFADVPGAVEELRKIILHLAVHGALVDQSDDDEPAKATLQKLSSRKLSFLDKAELPKAWASVALGELVALQKGKKPSSLNTERIGLPYLDIAALERGELRQFTEDDKCPRASSRDLVIVCDGSRSGLVLDGRDGVLGSTVSKIGYVGFIRDYLKLFLRSLYDDLNGAKKGAAIPHLNIPRLLAIPAPIPPLAEQTRILAKVDQLMALCDRLEAQQQERETLHASLARASLARFAESPTTANLELLFHDSFAITPTDLRKTIIDVASRGAFSLSVFSGKPVREALAIRRSERKQAWLKMKGRNNAYKEPDRVEYDEFPMLPKHWGLEYLGLLGTDPFDAVQTGPFGSQLLKTEFVESGVPVVAVGNLTGLGFSSKRLYHITQEKAEQLSRYDVQAGDLLFARTGATLGKVCLAPDEAKDWRMTGHILRARLHRGMIDPRLVVLFLWASDFVKSQVSGGIRGMTRPGFNTGLLERILIPIPPIAEQRQIIKRVDELMAWVDQLETQLTASRATADQLLSALVAELTGTPSNGKVSTRATSGTGRRGRPRKSPI